MISKESFSQLLILELGCPPSALQGPEVAEGIRMPKRATTKQNWPSLYMCAADSPLTHKWIPLCRGQSPRELSIPPPCVTQWRLDFITSFGGAVQNTVTEILLNPQPCPVGWVLASLEWIPRTDCWMQNSSHVIRLQAALSSSYCSLFA